MADLVAVRKSLQLELKTDVDHRDGSTTAEFCRKMADEEEWSPQSPKHCDTGPAQLVVWGAIEVPLTALQIFPDDSSDVHYECIRLLDKIIAEEDDAEFPLIFLHAWFDFEGLTRAESEGLIHWIDDSHPTIKHPIAPEQVQWNAKDNVFAILASMENSAARAKSVALNVNFDDDYLETKESQISLSDNLREQEAAHQGNCCRILANFYSFLMYDEADRAVEDPQSEHVSFVLQLAALLICKLPRYVSIVLTYSESLPTRPKGCLR